MNQHIEIRNAHKIPALDAATLGQEITITAVVERIEASLVEVTALGQSKLQLVPGEKRVVLTVTSVTRNP